MTDNTSMLERMVAAIDPERWAYWVEYLRDHPDQTAHTAESYCADGFFRARAALQAIRDGRPDAWRVKDYADGWWIYEVDQPETVDELKRQGHRTEGLFSIDAILSESPTNA